MIKKSENVMKERNVLITKRTDAIKGIASYCNVKVLNFFNPELQLKDIESLLKVSYQIYLLN